MTTSLKLTCAAAVVAVSFVDTPWVMTSAQTAYPEATISNGQIRLKLYLPHPETGFYRSTRFDWSGVIASLEYQGHNYYGPWFTRSDPPVRDFIYKDADIIAGAQSSIVGPAEEFQGAQGYATAKPGGTFVKIGVGVLRKVDDANYSGYANYPIVDSGRWHILRATASETPADEDWIGFMQELDDPASGFGYVYRKTLRLTPGKPELTIEHSLQNTGRLPLTGRQYNHNFLVLDGAATGADFAITVPFQIQTPKPPDPAFAVITGNRIAYKKTLVDQERVSFNVQGFGTSPSDYDITVENTRTGAGVRVTSDRPLASMALWSIRSVISMEPFVDVTTDVGATTTWKYVYNYYAKK